VVAAEGVLHAIPAPGPAEALPCGMWLAGPVGTLQYCAAAASPPVPTAAASLPLLPGHRFGGDAPDWMFAEDKKAAPLMLLALVGGGILLPLGLMSWLHAQQQQVQRSQPDP